MFERFAAALILVALPVATTGQTPAMPPATTSTVPGIQVTGKALVSSPVATALVRIVIHQLGDDDGNGMLARVKVAGIDGATIDEGGGTGPGTLLVHGRLTGITRAKLDAVSQAVRDYAANGPLHQLTVAQFYGLAADCPAIEQRAREAALADARRRAEAIAAFDNLRLGDQLAVSESGGCQPPGRFGGSFAIDVETLSMRVGVDETVTFAIAR